MAVFRIYVEKKPEFAVEADGVRHDISTLGIKVKSVRLFNRYDVEGIDPETFETASRTIFSEPAVDVTCAELPELQPGQRLLAVEYLPGQFDQRADSCEQCIQIMTQGDRPRVRNARVYLIDGEISDEEFETIKNTLINPVEAREASLAKFDTLAVSYDIPTTVKTLDGFIELSDEELAGFIDEEIKTPVSQQNQVVNFLVAGIDYNTTDASAGVSRGKLTDVIMVVQIDLGAGTVQALQIPRDTWVGTNVSSTGKINAVYGSRNIDGLAEVIYDRFSLPIDHYVTVDMDGFIKIVDAMGGVPVTIEESFTLEGVSFSPGEHVLSGIEAEKFVRERHSRSGGDIGRINAQRQFLAGLFSKMKSLSGSELASLSGVVMENVSTDLSVGTALSLVQEILKMDTDNMSFYMVPGQTATAYNGQSIWSVHKEELADLLNEHFRPYSDDVPASELSVEEVANTVDYYDDNSATVTDLLGGNDDEEEEVSDAA